MGLGKTLSMIALVATDLDRDNVAGIAIDMDENSKPGVSATLIIVPPPCKLHHCSHCCSAAKQNMS